MTFFVPHDIISRVENCKLDFEKGKSYLCIKSYYMNSGGFDFTKGKVYKCNKSYTIPCNNGRNISQWRLIGVEDMFKLVDNKGEEVCQTKRKMAG